MDENESFFFFLSFPGMAKKETCWMISHVIRVERYMLFPT